MKLNRNRKKSIQIQQVCFGREDKLSLVKRKRDSISSTFDGYRVKDIKQLVKDK